MGASRRLYFALWPDEHERAAIRELTRAAVTAAGGRPVTRSRLHLTLVFLGEVPASRVPAVRAAAGRVRSAPFAVELDRLGYWGKPGIFWLGPSVPPAALDDLHGGLRDALAAEGFAPEARAFRPHVTLARKVAGKPPLVLYGSARLDAGEFVLVQSKAGRRGAEYRVLERFRLA